MAIIRATLVPRQRVVTPSVRAIVLKAWIVPRYCTGGSQAGPHALLGRAGLETRTHDGPQAAKFHFSRRDAELAV